MSRKYSTQELMIIAASREIKDHEVVFVGMRLPITAFGVAKLTHAPDAVGLFECGIARSHPVREMLYTMADPPNQEEAAWCSGLIQVMGLLQRGRVDAGFIGGAEIDRFGNIYEGRHGRRGDTADGPGEREALSQAVTGGHTTEYEYGNPPDVLAGLHDAVHAIMNEAASCTFTFWLLDPGDCSPAP